MKIINELLNCERRLDADFNAGKVGAGHAGAVDVTRVAGGVAVEVLLIGIENVLNAGIELQTYVVDVEVVGNLRTQFKETGGFYQYVGRTVDFGKRWGTYILPV